jgi:hypothetical protein
MKATALVSHTHRERQRPPVCRRGEEAKRLFVTPAESGTAAIIGLLAFSGTDDEGVLGLPELSTVKARRVASPAALPVRLGRL